MRTINLVKISSQSNDSGLLPENISGPISSENEDSALRQKVILGLGTCTNTLTERPHTC